MDIHITRKGEKHGPYPEATARQFLEEGKLLPTDLAWHAGADGWKPLSEVLGATTQPPATPPPSPPPPGGGIPKRTMAGAAPAEEKLAGEKSEGSEPDDPDKIRVTRKGEPIGPYSREKAKEYFTSGQLLPTDWGWHDGMDDWKPINEVLGISVPTQTTAAAGKSGKGKKVAMIAGIVVLVAGLGAAGYFFLYPMLKGDSEGDGSGGGGASASGDWGTSEENAVKSLNNISNLGKGILAYFQDHGGKMPVVDKWCDDIFNEVRARKIYISPQAPNAKELNLEEKHCHYAMNAAVAGKPVFGKVVVLFESDLGWNGSGGLEDAKKFAKDRKATKLAVHFADGSSRLISPEGLDSLQWAP